MIVQNDDTYLKFLWIAPLDNHRPITAFTVLLFDKLNSAYVEVCQDLWLECRLEQSFFISLGYVQGDLPQVIVSATNVRGMGVYSEVSEGVGLIKTEPHKMNAPQRNAATTQD